MIQQKQGPDRQSRIAVRSVRQVVVGGPIVSMQPCITAKTETVKSPRNAEHAKKTFKTFRVVSCDLVDRIFYRGHISIY